MGPMVSRFIKLAWQGGASPAWSGRSEDHPNLQKRANNGCVKEGDSRSSLRVHAVDIFHFIKCDVAAMLLPNARRFHERRFHEMRKK